MILDKVKLEEHGQRVRGKLVQFQPRDITNEKTLSIMPIYR